VKNQGNGSDDGLYIAMGMGFGTILGLLIDNLGLGMSLGVLAGTVTGAIRQGRGRS
jgi:hypothetical protein